MMPNKDLERLKFKVVLAKSQNPEVEDAWFLASESIFSKEEAQQLKDKIQKALERFKKGVFVKCQAKECFPEHNYTEKDGVFYCSKLPIGEVNWD